LAIALLGPRKNALTTSLKLDGVSIIAECDACSKT
jgi:hypothetical protein